MLPAKKELVLAFKTSSTYLCNGVPVRTHLNCAVSPRIAIDVFDRWFLIICASLDVRVSRNQINKTKVDVILTIE